MADIHEPNPHAQPSRDADTAERRGAAMRVDNALRTEELARVTDDAQVWLRGRGVQISGDETSDQLADLLSAVEQFEQAVEGRGGDLMVDTAPAPERPDDRHFVLPMRLEGEGVRDYLDRLGVAAAEVMRHRPIA